MVETLSMPILPYALLHFARRQRTRWLGSGPWRSLSIDTVLKARHPSRAWHCPESIDGQIAAIHHPAQSYPATTPFFGATPEEFQVERAELRFAGSGIFPSRDTRVWSLSEAAVLGDEGAVYCLISRALVAETARTITRKAEDNPLLGIDRPLTARLSGRSLLLAGPFGNAHYHLLWDTLSKLALLPKELHASIDHYLVSAADTAYSRDWLQTAGIPIERVVLLNSRSHFVCEQLLFSSLPCESTCPTPLVRAALVDLLGASNSTVPAGDRWLWVSRRGQSLRDLLWEEQLLQAFPRFERVDLAGLSARDQISLFANASVVAGPHGSGFANLAFVNSTGDVIELLPAEMHRDPLYARITQTTGWRHHWAHVDFTRPTDLDGLRLSLKKILRAP
jgi:capsular polysaccharide biosynthesis protein